jgi:hypothetical protein
MNFFSIWFFISSSPVARNSTLKVDKWDDRSSNLSHDIFHLYFSHFYMTFYLDEEWNFVTCESTKVDKCISFQIDNLRINLKNQND